MTSPSPASSPRGWLARRAAAASRVARTARRSRGSTPFRSPSLVPVLWGERGARRRRRALVNEDGHGDARARGAAILTPDSPTRRSRTFDARKRHDRSTTDQQRSVESDFAPLTICESPNGTVAKRQKCETKCAYARRTPYTFESLRRSQPRKKNRTAPGDCAGISPVDRFRAFFYPQRITTARFTKPHAAPSWRPRSLPSRSTLYASPPPSVGNAREQHPPSRRTRARRRCAWAILRTAAPSLPSPPLRGSSRPHPALR